MGTETLYVRSEAGEFVPADQDLIVDTAKARLRTRLRRGVALTNPRAVRDFLTVNLGGRDCEYFCIVLLDARNRFLRFVELFRGTLDGAAVHPREIVKLVLQAEAGSVLLVHNHPSQVGEPSAADELITRRVRDVLAMIDVKVLDHLIVAGGDVISMAQRGLL